jgi:glutamyl-tRNA synthetase
MGKVAQPLRVAVCGRAASPGIDVTLYLVGRDACLRRIDRALAYIEERAAASA